MFFFFFFSVAFGAVRARLDTGLGLIDIFDKILGCGWRLVTEETCRLGLALPVFRIKDAFGGEGAVAFFTSYAGTHFLTGKPLSS